MKPLRAEMKSEFKYLSWVGVAFFSLCIVGALRDGAFGPGFGLLFFVGLSILLLLANGPIEADAELISWTVPLGRWQMRWDEVTKIEVAPTADAMLFGQDKRLALWLAMYRQPQREQMLQFILVQAQAWNIEVEQVPQLSRLLSKNTKAPRP